MKTENEKKHYPRFLLCTMKTIDSHFVPIPTLRRDDTGIEPCQVEIPTSPDKVRIPTLSGTILELPDSYFAQNVYIWSLWLYQVCSYDTPDPSRGGGEGGGSQVRI